MILFFAGSSGFEYQLGAFLCGDMYIGLTGDPKLPLPQRIWMDEDAVDQNMVSL